MSFDMERVFDDYALAYECACTRQELVEWTTHHPVTAALEAKKLVQSGTSAIDAAIKLYQDDWYGYREYGVRFCHFYLMVCDLMKKEEVPMREHTLDEAISLALLTTNVGCVVHWVEVAPSGRHATAGYTNPAGTKCLQLLIDVDYVDGFYKTIDVWGIDDNGGKGIFCGTLPL
jgi:hypothetical protein